MFTLMYFKMRGFFILRKLHFCLGNVAFGHAYSHLAFPFYAFSYCCEGGSELFRRTNKSLALGT